MPVESETLPPRLADDILLLEMAHSIRNITNRMDVTMEGVEESIGNLTESLVKVVDKLNQVVGYIPPGWLYYIMMLLFVMIMLGLLLIVTTSVVLRIMTISKMVKERKKAKEEAAMLAKQQDHHQSAAATEKLDAKVQPESQPKTGGGDNVFDQKDP